MKYINPNHLNPCLDRFREIAFLAPRHPCLRFFMTNGETIEGRYEGTSLGINSEGFHSFAALVAIKESDYPRSVELVEVVKIETTDAQ